MNLSRKAPVIALSNEILLPSSKWDLWKALQTHCGQKSRCVTKTGSVDSWIELHRTIKIENRGRERRIMEGIEKQDKIEEERRIIEKSRDKTRCSFTNPYVHMFVYKNNSFAEAFLQQTLVKRFFNFSLYTFLKRSYLLNTLGFTYLERYLCRIF